MERFFWHNSTLFPLPTQDPGDHRGREAPLDLLAWLKKLLSLCDLETTSPMPTNPSSFVMSSTMDRTAMTSIPGISHASTPVFTSSSSTVQSTSSIVVWIWCATDSWSCTHTLPGRTVSSQQLAACTLSLRGETGSGSWPDMVKTVSPVIVSSQGICCSLSRKLCLIQLHHQTTAKHQIWAVI